MELINFFTRWAHLLFGITWIGILYYFNFIQGGYLKKASPSGLVDAKAKLIPSALSWFRWGAMGTFLTGIILFAEISKIGINNYIVIGVTIGTLMFFNVWFVIWPNQKISLGMIPGNIPIAAGKALLASRTNTLFSAPMAYCMLYSAHPLPSQGYQYLTTEGAVQSMIVPLLVIALIELNGLKGKQGPLTTVKGVIASSLLLTLVLVATIELL